jgi:hypothetical protein
MVSMSLRELEGEKNSGAGGGRSALRTAADWESRAGAAVRGKHFVNFRPYGGQGIEYNQLT